MNPVDILVSAFATDPFGGEVGGSIIFIRGSCWVGVGVGVPPPANNFTTSGVETS